MIEAHNTSRVVVRYEEEKTREVKRIGGIYVRPLREVGWFEEDVKGSQF